MPNTHTLASVEFEHFTLELSSEHGHEVRTEPVRRTGHLAEIIAHRDHQLSIRYLSFHSIRFFSDDELLPYAVMKSRRGVTFAVSAEVKDKAGHLLWPRGGDDKTLIRLTYWNLTTDELLTLEFLRNMADREIFLSALKEAAPLMQMAAALETKNGRLALLAYNHAIAIARQTGATEELLTAMLQYMEACLGRGLVQPARKAVSDYRSLDNDGAGALDLARLSAAHKETHAALKEILREGMQRLLSHKPRFHSLGLAGILDIIITEKISDLPAGDLLWQTYLAASSERAVPVLRELWHQAKELNADEETLRIIEKTWRGFRQRKSGRNEGQESVPRLLGEGE